MFRVSRLCACLNWTERARFTEPLLPAPILANFPTVISDFFHANLLCYVLYFQLLKDCWELVGTFFEQLEIQYIWKGSREKNWILPTENSPIKRNTMYILSMHMLDHMFYLKHTLPWGIEGKSCRQGAKSTLPIELKTSCLGANIFSAAESCPDCLLVFKGKLASRKKVFVKQTANARWVIEAPKKWLIKDQRGREERSNMQ